jgi:hypothetical protein
MTGFYKPERGVVTTSKKKPKPKKEPKEKTPKYKGGGMAGMRRFNRGGKV